MKTIAITISAVLISVFSILAQSSLNSSSNYKMPLNAKKANNKNEVKVNYNFEKKSGLESASNYKSANNNKENAGGEFIILPVETEVGVASNGNYKSQFKGKKKSSKKEEIISQPVVIKDEKTQKF